MCILHPLIFALVQINMCKSSKKGNSHLQLLQHLNETKPQVCIYGICSDVQKWQILKLIIEVHVKGMKENLNLSTEKKVWIFTSQGVLTVISSHLSQLSKTTIISFCSYIKKTRHHDLAYSNITTDRIFC